MSDKLKLNREKGVYEVRVVLVGKVDEGVFRRSLYSWIDKNGVDVTDPTQWQRAVDEVSKPAFWQGNPNASFTYEEVPTLKEKLIEKHKVEESQKKSEPVRIRDVFNSSHRTIPTADLEDFRARAYATPMDQWESLRTPIPPLEYEGNKQIIYARRHDEKRILEAIAEERSQLDIVKVEAIAEAVNGNRIK